MVGRALAGRFAELGHQVVIGTRDPQITLARSEVDALGTPPYTEWQQDHPDIGLLTLPAAGAYADLLVNATNGAASIAALSAAAIGDRNGLVVMDVANPLDFSTGAALPSLTVVNTDSLAEQIQRTFPNARVVKTLNTVNAAVMVDPGRVPGQHTVFVAGEDTDAKHIVTALLGEIGWPPNSVVDLGGLVAARGTEMYLPLWVATMRSLGTADFNITITRA
jgi:predicted dinucleotide-binding enzyme